MSPAGLAQPHQKQTQGRVSSQRGAEVGRGLALFAQVCCEPECGESGGGGSLREAAASYFWKRWLSLRSDRA